MKISEVITGLLAQMSEHGDVNVVLTNPADDDDEKFYEVEVVTFVNRGTVVAPRIRALIGRTFRSAAPTNNMNSTPANHPPEQPTSSASMISIGVGCSGGLGSLVFSGCKEHPHRTDLPCCKIRRLDGSALTVADTWSEMQRIAGEKNRLREALEYYLEHGEAGELTTTKAKEALGYA